MSDESKSLEALRASVDALLDPRRVAACVHACAGLSTEALESGNLREALELLGKIAEAPGLVRLRDIRNPARNVLRALGRI